MSNQVAGNAATRFMLGSHLCREPMPPMAELKQDMENLKRHGFNLVKFQEHWMIDEPLEGRYDFSRYEELIAHAAGLDMTVYLGLTCEQAPHWLYEKHPDCRMIRRDGTPVAYEAPTTLPADGKPGPCYDHPGAMAEQLRFITALVATLGSYEHIVWNTWQEVSYWAEAFAGGQVCYCPNTLRAYHDWLEQKYGDLDALNRGWNTRYLKWSAIQPERGAGRQPEPQELTFRYFMDNVQIGNVLRRRAAAIREADPLKRPVFAHLGGPTIGSGRDWTYARCQDFLGSSCYPAWGSYEQWDDEHPNQAGAYDRHASLAAEMWNGVAMRFDYVRCANPPGSPVWAAEFQGGPFSMAFHKGRVPSADDMRRWMLTAVGSGVTAISFWVTRAEIMAAEMNGFSLLDSEGDTTERFEEAARVGQALDRHASLFGAPTLPRSRVAILVNERNYQFCETLSFGAGHLAYDVRGWHRMLWEAGIPVDFLEVMELEDPYAREYAAIIMPFPLCLSEDTAASLAAYVEQGGNLLSEACPGRSDEHGICHRGEMSPRLRELFGVRQAGLTMVREPGDKPRWMPAARSWGEFLEPAVLQGAGPLEGSALRAQIYIETLDPVDADPILRYGEAV
ncbi:MAG: beta-galactosidase, partial [Lentisphaerae bacterium]|nr:beta-galactosidase [Lentisphaerota bacterium]